MKRAFLCLFLLQLTACGYSFSGGGSILPPDVKKVYIPLVENNTPEPGLAITVTEALRDQFERFGVLAVLDEPAGADATLRARIIKLKRDTQTVTSKTNSALQVSTVLTVAAELRRSTGAVLWRDLSLSASKGFGTQSDVVVTSSADFAGGNLDSQDLGSLNNREIGRGQEQQVLEDLAEEIARKAYDGAVTPEF